MGSGMASETMRVMWLLNHSSARKFEVAMLKRIGVREIFLPKTFPQEILFRSASVDYSEDANLTLDSAELALLNQADWYGDAGKAAWEVANRHFDVLFFIAYKPEILHSVSRNFKGVAIWRAYGLDQSLSYGGLLSHFSKGLRTVERMGRRFWFGEAYAHLHESENGFLRDRALFLPLGLHDCAMSDGEWAGTDARIFFVCPDIGFNPYYAKVYADFKRDFGSMPHAIGGAQPVLVNDASVLGFLPADQHARNMRELRVMFYHSTEPNHVHYHPFEAIRAGMPLVFMGGGMLDRLGGIDLPGRCRTLSEARLKLDRVLKGDVELIAAIRDSQKVLLDPMRMESCEPAWRVAWSRIQDSLGHARTSRRVVARARSRIAVILPVAYRGGTLRGAKLLVEALLLGSRSAGEEVEVVFGYPIDGHRTSQEDVFEDLRDGVAQRLFQWRNMSGAEARRAMRYAGHANWEPGHPAYAIPDDGMQQFGDCSLWLFVSDRILLPVLPIRPYACLVYDYIQRRVDVVDRGANSAFIAMARQARRVLVTTEFTRKDALSYAGVPANRIALLPPLAPLHLARTDVHARQNVAAVNPYFVWPTNIARHKNHRTAFLALERYYAEYDGKLDCHVMGVDTDDLEESFALSVARCNDAGTSVDGRVPRLRFLGELSDSEYIRTLAGATFLWHPARVDNGTFCVIEAALCGVPSLSSDYPAMRELDERYELCLQWMPTDDPRQMARKLKWMEEHAASLREYLPTPEALDNHDVAHVAADYWNTVRECL